VLSSGGGDPKHTFPTQDDPAQHIVVVKIDQLNKEEIEKIIL
jgi:hypothetical protein